MVDQPGWGGHGQRIRALYGTVHDRFATNGLGDGDERGRYFKVGYGDGDIEPARGHFDDADGGCVGSRRHATVHRNRDGIGKHHRDLVDQPGRSWEHQQRRPVHRTRQRCNATDGDSDSDKRGGYIENGYGHHHSQSTRNGNHLTDGSDARTRSNAAIQRNGYWGGQWERDLVHQSGRKREYQLIWPLYCADDADGTTNRNGNRD